MSSPQKPKESRSSMMMYAGLSMQWLVMLGLATWGGVALDRRMGIKALWVVVLPLLALVVSLYQLIKTLSRKNPKP